MSHGTGANPPGAPAGGGFGAPPYPMVWAEPLGLMLSRGGHSAFWGGSPRPFGAGTPGRLPGRHLAAPGRCLPAGPGRAGHCRAGLGTAPPAPSPEEKPPEPGARSRPAAAPGAPEGHSPAAPAPAPLTVRCRCCCRRRARAGKQQEEEEDEEEAAGAAGEASAARRQSSSGRDLPAAAAIAHGPGSLRRRLHARRGGAGRGAGPRGARRPIGSLPFGGGRRGETGDWVGPGGKPRPLPAGGWAAPGEG